MIKKENLCVGCILDILDLWLVFIYCVFLVKNFLVRIILSLFCFDSR